MSTFSKTITLVVFLLAYASPAFAVTENHIVEVQVWFLDNRIDNSIDDTIADPNTFSLGELSDVRVYVKLDMGNNQIETLSSEYTDDNGEITKTFTKDSSSSPESIIIQAELIRPDSPSMIVMNDSGTWFTEEAIISSKTYDSSRNAWVWNTKVSTMPWARAAASPSTACGTACSPT